MRRRLATIFTALIAFAAAMGSLAVPAGATAQTAGVPIEKPTSIQVSLADALEARPSAARQVASAMQAASDSATATADPATAAATATQSYPAATASTQSAAYTQATPSPTPTYTHSSSANQNGVTFTVQWDDAPAGQATSFRVTAEGGSGAYKARMDVPTYWDGGGQENVCDPSRGVWIPYTDFPEGGSADFSFEFTASGTYGVRFWFMDINKKITWLKTDFFITVNDPARPAVSQIVADAVAQCKKETDGSEYAMALWLHDWELDQLDYDRALNWCSAESGLTRHTGTCESYQRIYEKLLNAAGIANGRIEGNGHTWNALRIDGEWCQADLTWDDSDSAYGDLEQRHLYFGLTDELMAIAHSDHAKNYAAEGYAYRSTAPTNSYYVRNGKAREWAGAYAARIQAHLDAGDTEFEIDADNPYDPPSISGIENGLVAWQMNQMEWKTTSKKANLVAESKVEMTSDSTWTTKYAFKVGYKDNYFDVSNFKHGTEDKSTWTAPTKDGHAFAGWYEDEACTKVFTGTSGSAYARFVPMSELIDYLGVSLRNDFPADYSKSTLRFCYAFQAPAGCTFSSAGWDWNLSWSGSGRVQAANRWLSGGDGTVANIAVKGIERANFEKECSTRGYIRYSTPDGTAAESVEPAFHEGTVQEAASGILSGGAKNASENEYAKSVLGDLSFVNSGSSVNGEYVALQDVASYKSSKQQTEWTAPNLDGYAFAGWYEDEACTKVFTGTTGSAYARFVPVSELIDYLGVSLRNDFPADYSKSTLRFCYAFQAPAGCTFSSAGWDWNLSWSGSGRVQAANRWLSGGDGTVANIAVKGIGRANFEKECSTRGYIRYSTPDGTAAEAVEPAFHEGTVQEAASGIVSGGASTPADITCANGILNTLD